MERILLNFSNPCLVSSDMRMRVGNTTEFDHSVQLGIWGMGGILRGPINPKSGKFLFCSITVIHILG